MTIEDLREHGVLLPESEWGTHRLESTTRGLPMLAAFAVAAASLALAYLGDGGAWTWTGTGGVLACLLAITWMCDRAVRRQRRRVRRERAAGEGIPVADPAGAADRAADHADRPGEVADREPETGE